MSGEVTRIGIVEIGEYFLEIIFSERIEDFLLVGLIKGDVTV